MIKIPNFNTFYISDIVCDYNGTIAKDGIVLETLSPLFKTLAETYTIHVITADTFGSVEEQLKAYNISIKILNSDDHTEEKAAFIESLGAENCIALGNGNNDRKMLLSAAVGIAVLGDEGCSTQTLINSDLVCKSAQEALSLLIHPKRLIATLRQ